MTDGAPRRVRVPRPSRPAREAGWAPLLELVGLSALCVAQPVLNVFGEGADIFVAYGARRLEVVLFALAVTFAVPLLLYGLELLAGVAGQRWRRMVHLGSLSVLLLALASQVLKRQTDLRPTWVAALAVVLAALGAVALWRWQVPRLFLRFLSAASVAFVALFLFASPVVAVVVPSGSVDVADADVGDPAPVVWIVFDELPVVSLLGPGDRVDRELFPNFASLAEDATWYRNHTTVAAVTPEAVPALLTGNYPEEEATLPVADRHPENLFTLLGDSYHVNGSEGWTHLCPDNVCGRGVTADDPPVPRLLSDAQLVWRQRTWPRARETRLDAHAGTFRLRRHQTADFVERLDDDDEGRPRLDFMHIVLPHVAYEYLPSGQRYTAPGFPEGAFFGGWFDDGVAGAAREQHLLQLAHTDRLLGQVLDRLRQLDRYDESLVVVTADHGAAFVPGSPNRGLSEENYHQIMWTPLFVKAPAQRSGEVDDTPVQSIDVLPTVAELLDVRLPWRVDGRPIRQGRPSVERPRLFDFYQNRIKPDDGQFATVDGEEGFRRVIDEPPVRTTDGDELALYRQGPHGGLVGRRVRDLPAGTEVEAVGHLDRAAALADVDVDGAVLPAYQSGEVMLRGPEPTFAVAVNGVVGGISKGYLPNFLPRGALDDEGFDDRAQPRRWWTVVPPSLLRDGDNEVELHLVEGEPGGERLRPVVLRDGG